jgi:predicted PurR-regulated permease PerM
MKRVRIDIDTKTFIRFWLVVIAFAFAILAIYNSLTALILIGIAFFLAMALNIPVSFIARHLPGKSRVGGTAIAFVLVVAVLTTFLFLVVPPIVEQSLKVAETFPALVESATSQWQGVNQFVADHNLQDQVNQALKAAQDSVGAWASQISGNVVSSIGSIAGTLVSSFLVLVLTFLMLVEGPTWMRWVWGLYNDQKRMEHHRKLAHRMYGVVTGYVVGQLTVSSIGAAMSGLTVFVLSLFFNVPANLAFPTIAIAFTLSLIPMFGATIAGVLITILLGFNDITAAIIFAAFFIIYQQVENNFISPVVQSRRLELSALMILIAVTIGVMTFGILGGIVSIPVAGCIKVLLEDYLAHAKANRQASRPPADIEATVEKKAPAKK